MHLFFRKHSFWTWCLPSTTLDPRDVRQTIQSRFSEKCRFSKRDKAERQILQCGVSRTMINVWTKGLWGWVISLLARGKRANGSMFCKEKTLRVLTQLWEASKSSVACYSCPFRQQRNPLSNPVSTEWRKSRLEVALCGETIGHVHSFLSLHLKDP